MRAKGCCPGFAACIPKPVYAILFVLFNLGLGAVGVLLLKAGADTNSSVQSHFFDRTFPHAAVAIGAVLGLLCLYGVFGHLICRGSSASDQIKCYVVIATLVCMTVSVFALLAFFNSDDKTNITDNLEFSWQRYHRDSTKQYLISEAQAEHACCGFFTKKDGSFDRPVKPCPDGAKRGCEFRLRRAVIGDLSTAAMWFGISAGSLIVLLLLGYFYAQHLDLSAQQGAMHNNVDDQRENDAVYKRPLLDNSKPSIPYHKGNNKRA